MEEKLRCPRCNSTLAYIRLKTGIICCRSCGYIGRAEKDKEEEKKDATIE